MFITVTLITIPEYQLLCERQREGNSTICYRFDCSLFEDNKYVSMLFNYNMNSSQNITQFDNQSKYFQKMDESKDYSPQQIIKRSSPTSSPTITSKSKSYLPSRYAQQRKVQKNGFQDILNSIQTKTNTETIKSNKPISPKIKQILIKQQINTYEQKIKISQFKSKPLKRQKYVEINYNQIFLNPMEEALQQLKMKTSLQDNIKSMNKQYEKLLNIEKEQSKEVQEEKSPLSGKMQVNYQEVIEMLDDGDILRMDIDSTEDNFYDQQIAIDPPDMPLNSNQQPISSGASYAPSIPSNYKNFCSLNLKELLMRVRTGININQAEKEAHLSYLLGEIYSLKKMYREALKFNKRFIGLAKAMEDYIGMNVGANRMGISYYNCNSIQKSMAFHHENLKLSSNDNCFVGLYNIGICNRKLKKFNEALQYFKSAFGLAQEKGDEESECIALGQIGVTYQSMQLYLQAIQQLQKSNQLCEKIKKKQLKLANLRIILKIYSMLKNKPLQKVNKIMKQGFICSSQVLDKKKLDIFRCNIGIVKGIQQIQKQLVINRQDSQIQEI